MIVVISLLLGLALPTAAGSPPPLDVDHEAFYFLGWNKGCSVAVSHYAYPPVGEAIASDPVSSRVGTMTIAPGHETQRLDWLWKADGAMTWDETTAARARRDLRRMGYVEPGYKELVRADPVIDERDLPQIINSTEAFRTRSPGPWPPAGWRLARVHYNRISACGLLVFQRGRAPHERYQALVIRIENPAAREDRSLAHLTNARLLLERGEATGALAEAEIASGMAPDSALALYHYAAFLNLLGRTDESIDALKRAVAIDPRFSAKIKDDVDFQTLHGFPRYQELMH